MRLPFLFAAVLIPAAGFTQNLVFNGDFSLGNVGFNSGHTYVAPATNAIGPEGVYTLTTNTRTPFVLCTLGDGIADYSDHTTGTGQFMIINGATTFNSLVYEQALTGLVVGQTYRFDAWISRWTLGNSPTAKLNVLAGTTLITSFQDPGVGGVWVSQTGTFVASATSLSLQIRNLESSAAGNDFGLDDLSVQAVPEPATLAVFGLGIAAAIRRRKRK